MRLSTLLNLAWMASNAFATSTMNRKFPYIDTKIHVQTLTATTATATSTAKGMKEYEAEYGYIKWIAIGGQIYIWGQVAVFCYYWGNYLLNKETYDARMAEHRRKSRQGGLRGMAAAPAVEE